MLQLIYISTARHPISDDGLREILNQSRRNNGRVGVTGLLVVGGRRFLQVLEGPNDVVTATFDRIKQDQRHHAFVVLSSRLITERGFGSWSMGFERGLDSKKSDLVTVVTDLTSGLSDPDLRAQFVGFAKLHRAAA